MDGALSAIRYARERGVPLLGTCGGFQHAIVEFARNVLGFRDADHAETSPDAERLVITRLSCSLAGKESPVTIRAGTRAERLYGADQTIERYYCSYGVNPVYQDVLEDAGMNMSGVGEAGEARIIELPDHPFFVATLFVPQARSTPDAPHPVVAGYAGAVKARAASSFSARADGSTSTAFQ
jgi:CTP synthase (UTP-ammonia lyase)